MSKRYEIVKDGHGFLIWDTVTDAPVVGTLVDQKLLGFGVDLMNDAHERSGADELAKALEEVLPYMEAAENEGLVGDEGCHWPVEIVRAALAKHRGGE